MRSAWIAGMLQRRQGRAHGLAARCGRLPAACLLVCLKLHAQNTGAAQPASDAPLPTLRASTQLVVVDVLVQDSRGRPVHGLTRANFRLEENRLPQTVRNFDEHTSAERAKPGPPAPVLPPGTFTNYTPNPPGGTLSVLLIDALNTPRTDQTYLRTQLAKYVQTAPPGPVAIFGLNSRLYLLQGFTSDSATLKQAVAGKLNSRGSDLLDDPNGTGLDQQLSSEAQADNGPATDLIVSNLQQFEADTSAQRLQLRAQYTLDALNNLGHYLQNFPGRKNLVWFSGSFPINVLPDPNLANGFSTLQINQQELRETTNLLLKAQVAVYPVDARGVQTQPMFDAGSSGRRYAANPTTLGRDLSRFDASQANEHSTMDEVAANTGGHAFYGTNDLAEAVTSAIESGANYYTLTYSPTSRDEHGALRTIHVELQGPPAAAGLQLSYRKGYYAAEHAPTLSLETADPKAPNHAPPDHASGPGSPSPPGYRTIVLSHGSPLPQDILFQTSIAPASAVPADHLAPGNLPGPSGALHGPYRQLAVQFAALPGDFVFTPQPDGRRLDTVAFHVLVFDEAGTLLNSVEKAIRFDLPPAAYQKLMAAGVGMQLDVSVPEHRRSWVRIVVEDVPSSRFGAVELSSDRIGHTPAAPSTR